MGHWINQLSLLQIHICTSIFIFTYISQHIIHSEMIFLALEVYFSTLRECVTKVWRLKSQSCLVLWWEAGYFWQWWFIDRDLLHTRTCFLVLSQSLLNWSLNSNKIIKIEHAYEESAQYRSCLCLKKKWEPSKERGCCQPEALAFFK